MNIRLKINKSKNVTKKLKINRKERKQERKMNLRKKQVNPFWTRGWEQASSNINYFHKLFIIVVNITLSLQRI